MSLWDSVRRFLNAPIIKEKAPPPAKRPSRATGAQPGLPPAFQHVEDPARAALPVVKYQRERYGPRFKAQAWVQKITTRQRILVVLGAMAVLVMLGMYGVRLLTERRLPQRVQGLYRTDVEAYALRRFELHARSLAFLTGDTARPVVVYPIQRVTHRPAEGGVEYVVRYTDHNGEAVDFSFVFLEDTGQIRFLHQRQLVWRKEPGTRSIYPNL